MKRYLLFYGDQCCPSGGMDDLYGEYYTIEEAVSAFESKVSDELSKAKGYYKNKEQLMHYRWANIYDCQLKKEVWNDTKN